MTTQRTATSTIGQHLRTRRRDWLVPAGLVLLSIVPVVAGAMRLTELTAGTEITESNARFFASPVPVVAHIVSATVFCLLGAFQFVPRLRRGRPRWHQVAGRIVLPAGVTAGLSGIWMAVFYTRPELDMFVRLFFGSLMVASLLLALRAIVRRDIATHRAWMIRGYAVGIAAGTQVFTTIPWSLANGGVLPDPTTAVALLTAGWIINLAVAEFVIRRRSLS
ncbi:putative membrane protein [Salinibacterium sp. CAN_S4]|uniref:DUF2306 domain-containing protein n=1 Tax=Salinibacterium sp. CAN_S4 TaxID=2787727 RepID=UPI001A26997C